MASRHIKKLQNDQLVEPQLQSHSSSEEEPQSQRQSLFALLNEDDRDDSGSDSPEESSVEQPKQSPLKSAKVNNGSSAPSTKKKAKKKKKKSQPASAPQAAHPSGEQNSEDLDKLLKEMNITLNERVPETRDEALASARSVLHLNYKKLKPEEELRKIFGSKVISENSREDDNGINVAGASRRVKRLAQRGLIKQAQLKEGLIISPRYDWPRMDGSLRMERDTESDAPDCFRYVHSSSFQIANEHFRQAQQTYDPNQVMAVLQRYPYHVPTLQAVADLYRSSGQHETADDMLARSIYALEMAWPLHFRLGYCTLECDLPENIPLFKALFQHVRSLIKRGLYTTALENAKAMYTLNPLDPYGILQCMDYIALKAEEYSFIQAFCSEVDPAGTSLAYLPNWSFSLPLARLLQQQQQKPQTSQEEPFSSLEDAVLQYPEIVIGLWERLEEAGVHPDKDWREILKNKWLNSVLVNHAGRSHLISIYLTRQVGLYKNPHVLGLLREACEKAVADPSRQQSSLEQAQRLWLTSDVNEWEHLRLGDYSDTEAALPPEELQAMMQGPPGDMGNADFDILDADRIQDVRQRLAEILQARGLRDDDDERDVLEQVLEQFELAQNEAQDDEH